MNQTVTPNHKPVTTSVYESLGGAKGIASIVDDVVAAHLENPVIRARFLPYLSDMDKVQVIKQHFCQMIGMGCGGPEVYEGRDMISVHRGMNISDAEFVAAVDDIMLVLDRHQVEESVKKEVLFMTYSLKKQVVNL